VAGVAEVDPTAPGCGAVNGCAAEGRVAGSSAAEIGAAGGGEVSWGADTAARVAGRVVPAWSDERVSAAIPQVSTTITVTAAPRATQRRLQ
jgi:hypothetical protein